MTSPLRARPGRTFAARLGLLAVLVLAAGCGQQQGKLSGQVLYQGKPLPGGRVTFRPADPKANAVTVPIGTDGHYEATLPVGDGQISVDNRELKPPPPRTAPASGALPPGLKLPGDVKVPPPPKDAPKEPPPDAPQKMPGNYVPIPESYHSVDTSGLKYSLKGGSETLNIELK